MSASDAVHFYTRVGCPFSVHLSRRLQRLGLSLEYHDIWADAEAASFVRSVAHGNETVPTVVVGEVALVAPSAKRVISVVRDQAPDLLPAPGAARSGRWARWWRSITPQQ